MLKTHTFLLLVIATFPLFAEMQMETQVPINISEKTQQAILQTEQVNTPILP